MGRRRRPASYKPATKKDRDKAYRIRRKRASGRRLTREQHNWLRKYLTDREDFAATVGRREDFSAFEKKRYRNLKRRKRPLSKEEQEELAGYERHAKRARKSKGKTALEYSRLLAEAIAARTLGVFSSTVESEWTRPPQHKAGGIAITTITFRLIATEVFQQPKFPRNVRNMRFNLRALVKFRGSRKRGFGENIESWQAITAHSRRWRNGEVAVLKGLKRVLEMAYVRGFLAVDVMVAP